MIYRHDVQVRTTEPGRRHLDENVVLLVQRRDRDLVERELLRVGVEAQCLHHFVHRNGVKPILIVVSITLTSYNWISGIDCKLAISVAFLIEVGNFLDNMVNSMGNK